METIRFQKLVNKLNELNVPFSLVNNNTVQVDRKYFSYELHSALIANYHFGYLDTTFYIQTI